MRPTSFPPMGAVVDKFEPVKASTRECLAIDGQSLKGKDVARVLTAITEARTEFMNDKAQAGCRLQFRAPW